MILLENNYWTKYSYYVSSLFYLGGHVRAGFLSGIKYYSWS